jgi:hypothetical protein
MQSGITARLRGRVRRRRPKRRVLVERAGLDRAVDLVGRDLEVTDAGPPRRLEHHEGAEHVCLDELSRGIDRTIHVRLGSEVDDCVAALDRGVDGVAVRDVRLDQLDAVRVETFEILTAARVGELVEHADVVARVGGDPIVHVGGADEPGSPRDQDPHAAASSSRSAR